MLQRFVVAHHRWPFTNTKVVDLLCSPSLCRLNSTTAPLAALMNHLTISVDDEIFKIKISVDYAPWGATVFEVTLGVPCSKHTGSVL